MYYAAPALPTRGLLRLAEGRSIFKKRKESLLSQIPLACIQLRSWRPARQGRDEFPSYVTELLRVDYALLGESAGGTIRPQFAATGGPGVWKSFVLRWVDYRHSRFNPCSVNVCTGTVQISTATEYEPGVPVESGTQTPFRKSAPLTRWAVLIRRAEPALRGQAVAPVPKSRLHRAAPERAGALHTSQSE